LQQSEGLAWPAPSQLSLGGPIPRRASRLTLLADLDRAGAVALDLLGIRADEEALARTGEPVPVLRPELQAALVYTPPRSPLRLSVGSSLQAAGSLARTLRGLGSRPKQVSFGMRL
jgi:hypothetical protein